MQESLAGEDKIGNTVQLSLTVDLNRRGLESLPEEIVQILKQDVERYVLPTIFLFKYVQDSFAITIVVEVVTC